MGVGMMCLLDCNHPDSYARIGDYGVYYACDKDNDRVAAKQKGIFDRGFYFVTREEFKKAQFLHDL